MTQTELTPADRANLRIFRQVAAECRAALATERGSEEALRVYQGYLVSDAESTRVRNMCVPVRRAYLKSDPVNMLRTLGKIRTAAPEPIQRRIDELLVRYRPIGDELASASILNDRRVTHAEMFEAWIDAVVFPEIPAKRQPFLQMADELGKAVEGIGLYLAERMAVVLLEADDIVADFLGERRGDEPPPEDEEA